MHNKILGSLTFSAIADAMGAATENLTFEQIREKFDGKVTTLLKPDEDNFALGNEPGQVTDDFSQTYMICLEIINDSGKITTEGVKNAIIEWSKMPEYFNRFAGPTTRSAVEMYKTGSDTIKPAEGAVTIDYASKATNGAAMKISPAGFMNPGNLDVAIKDAFTIGQVTHDNHLALSGAAAVAAAVSAAMLDDISADSIIAAGLYGAERGEELGKKYSREVAGPSVTERIKLAIEIANENSSREERLRKLYDIIGSGLHISEAVPTAFGIIAINNGDPFESVIDAVNIGYDTDTVGMIVGSIVGGLYEKDEKAEKMLNAIEEVNNFKIREMSEKLKSFVD
jgi:ADP-ribosylglycohydrolase